MRSLVVFLVCLTTTLGQPAEARSRNHRGRQAGVVRAKQLFVKAEAHFQRGQYREALTLYHKAYEAKPLPGFHFNIAQCYSNLGDHEKAVHHFEQYLMRSRNPHNKADARRLLDLSKKALAREEEQEEKAVNEQPPDLEPESRPVITAPDLPPRKDDGPRRISAKYFWTGVGVTAVLLATTTVTGALALRQSSKFKDDSTPFDELQGLKNSGERLRTAASVTFGLGLATAAATVILYFWTDFHPTETEATVGASPLSRGAVFSMGGRF